MRLFALIGICIVNIVFMGLPAEVAMSPAGSFHDQVAAFFVEALFQSKFFILFSFLFGWGIYIQEQSTDRAGASFGRRYARRLIALAVMGCLHAVLVFSGDILFIYAFLGLLFWPLLTLTSLSLLRVAYAMIPLSVICLIVLGLIIPENFEASLGFGLGGSFLDATKARLEDWPWTLGFLLLFQAPLVFGAFAMGFAAGKTNFFAEGSQGRSRVRRSLPWLIGLGIPLNIVFALSMGALYPADYELLALLGLVTIAFGAPMLAAVYLHFMLFLNDHVRLPALLVSAGQNSLSVYVLQGIVGGFLFSNYGFGLFGQIGLAGLIPVGLLVAIFAIIAVGLFAQWSGRGPLEALLRRVTYLN